MYFNISLFQSIFQAIFGPSVQHQDFTEEHHSWLFKSTQVHNLHVLIVYFENKDLTGQIFQYEMITHRQNFTTYIKQAAVLM